MIGKKYFSKALAGRNQRLMEKELRTAIDYTRNIVILGRGRNISSETLMSELADITELLKPAFQDMGHYLHINEIEKSEAVLYKFLGTGISKDLGRFLSGWDMIPPDQLLGTIEIYSDSLKDDYLSRREKNNELISDLIYLPVVLNAMLVLLDFVYVAFFIEQQAMLNNLYV